jgi:hypothetical protein
MRRRPLKRTQTTAAIPRQRIWKKSGVPANVGVKGDKVISMRDIDISELRAMWRKRAAAVEEVRRRADPTGMTRPARDPEEAAFLRETGQEGPFTEVEMPGWREWVTRRDKPARFYAPPSEVRDDAGEEGAG